MPDSGKLPAASKHFFVCIKTFFPGSVCKASRLPGGGSEQQQWTAIRQLCREENNLKAFCLEDTFGTWMGFLWHFNSVHCPWAQCCALYSVRMGGGEWRSREPLRSRWLFRRDELGDECSWRNGAKCAEQSRAAVSLPTRAPTGVIEGFNFNYVGSAVVI